MSHTFRILQILLFCLLVFPCQAKALELTRNLPTSARDMEFYYQHKHPESLPGMLRAFDKNRRFAHGELRLITAAFLAEIFKNEPEQTSKLLDLAKDLSPEAQRMFVWAAHLSNLDKLKNALKNLPVSQEKALQLQLAHSPAPLERWDICSGSAVVHMYWGAFFANAEQRYLDTMIDAALLHARLKAQGLVQDPRYKGSMEVAASLYEMSPRHKAVRDRLEARRTGLSAAERDTINIILKH
ncbi:MAG: translation initiation factor 2 [Desulfovibrio sp.]|nr:translation initiation factor 2 [Desulfovibrio sp.]